MYFTQPDFSTPVFVATVAGGQTGRVYPLAGLYRADRVKYLRVNLMLQALTVAADKMDVSVRIQISGNGVTWPGSTTEPTIVLTNAALDEEGTTDVQAFQDVSADLDAPYFRLVLWVKNAGTETAHATALAAVRVEQKSC